MGILDIIIAFAVLMGLWRGFRQGLIRSTVSLVGWFIALVAATRLADDVAPQMAGFVASPVLQVGLGFLAVVLVVMVVMQIIGMLVTHIIKGLKLGLVDQMAGGVLGAAKSIMIVLIIMSVSSPILVRSPMWKSSVVAPELLPYAPFAKEFAVKVLGKAWEQIDDPMGSDAVKIDSVNQ